MDVVIVGAHGKVARRLALLVARGDRVRGVIRNPAHVDDLRAEGSEPVVCDLERVGADKLAGAISGADAVVFAAGAGPGQRGRAQAHRRPRRGDQAAPCGTRCGRRAVRHGQLRRRRGPARGRRRVRRLPPGEGRGRPGAHGQRSRVDRRAAGVPAARAGSRAGFAWPSSRSAARCRATTSPACSPPSSTSRGPPSACST